MPVGYSDKNGLIVPKNDEEAWMVLRSNDSLLLNREPVTDMIMVMFSCREESLKRLPGCHLRNSFLKI
jgi:hypothetical protein